MAIWACIFTRPTGVQWFVNWITFFDSLAAMSIFSWNVDGIAAYGNWLEINFDFFAENVCVCQLDID
jgi:hypothetical protein